MKKLFVLSLAIALAALFAMPAKATESRQVALAGAGSYIEDDFNIFWWPGTLPNYANTVWMSVNSEYYDEYEDLFLMIGGTYGLGEDNRYGVLGMWFWHMDEGLNPFGDYEYINCWWPGMGRFNDVLDHKVAIMWGYAMEGASFGLGFSRADNAYKTTFTTPQYKYDAHQAYTTVNAGVRFDIGDNMYMDIAFDLSWVNYSWEQADAVSSEDRSVDANKMYSIRARGFYEWKENFTWVPYFAYQGFDFRIKSDDPAFFDSGDKATNFTIGLGSNITINEDNLLVFAVDIYDFTNRKPSQDPDDEAYEIKYIVFPRFYLALESDVTDWLTFRAGGWQELGKIDEKCTVGIDEDITGTATWSDFEMSLGLGFHVGDFDIDCVLNPQLPLYMGYWLTGYQSYSGDPPIWMASALYHF